MMLDTYVNPYSNKASADVSLRGTTWFEVVLPDQEEEPERNFTWG